MELSEIRQDEHGYHFECKGGGVGKIEMDLVEAREKCELRSGDVNWNLGQSDSHWIAVVSGIDLAKVKKFRSYLREHGWKPTEDEGDIAGAVS